MDYDEDSNQSGKPSTLPYPFPYPQRIIITSIAFWQPLPMHRRPKHYQQSKERDSTNGLERGL